MLRRLPQGLRHLRAIIVAVHDCYVCAHKAERLSIDRKSAIARLDKSRPAAVGPLRNRE
jgi:hypothetical protein